MIKLKESDALGLCGINDGGMIDLKNPEILCVDFNLKITKRNHVKKILNTMKLVIHNW